MYWKDAENKKTFNYICGYCGSDIASQLGYSFVPSSSGEERLHEYIRICHKCSKPTYISKEGEVVPSAIYGKNIKHLPDEIEVIYNEARKCFSINAFTSVIMCCRKLIMHIACENGAKEDLPFGKYVQHLKDEGYVAKPIHNLAEAILKYGNIANHKLELYDEDAATNIMLFTETILRTIYELPKIYSELSNNKK